MFDVVEHFHYFIKNDAVSCRPSEHPQSRQPQSMSGKRIRPQQPVVVVVVDPVVVVDWVMVEKVVDRSCSPLAASSQSALVSRDSEKL